MENTGMSEEKVPDTAQDVLACSIKDCEKNCQFYCNDCHHPMCEQCRDEHQNGSETKKHELVPYRQRKPQLPVEKCKLHPTRNIEIYCKDCNVLLCSKCVVKKGHSGHTLEDLEEIYAEKVECCRAQISKIRQKILLTSQDSKIKIEEDSMKLKRVMENIRDSVKAETESLKESVERVTLKKLEQVNTLEISLFALQKSHETTFENYNQYLKTLDEKFNSFLSVDNIQDLLFSDFENFDIKPSPEPTKLVLPKYTASQCFEEDINKLLGNINVSCIESDIMKSVERSNTQLKLAEIESNQDKKKSDVRKTLSLSSSVAKVKEYTITGVDHTFHISLGKSGKLWVGVIGVIVQTDISICSIRNQIHKIIINSSEGDGNHTVIQDGDLIYTDKENKVINRITPDDTITDFIKTGDWEPRSIHSSHINGDILVGMQTDEEAKVTRYNKTGIEIQNIQRDEKGQELYSLPHYITDNINGDVCVSDFSKHAVVVVDKSGQHRFSYTGQGSEFFPYGLCTDILGHILVCDSVSETVHLLDQDGQFLSLLLTSQQGVKCPLCLCVDDENNLWVGQYDSDTLTVYKYLQ
ncbi:E3 ubiquitin-protein ligase TRIM71-like [Magallana gigas]|uniref:E3 ubiquitin-protein ligase TRIM71-like n=1 Tax=Magallana gigas TaxID=29159 RepID=UPI00333E1FF3